MPRAISGSGSVMETSLVIQAGASSFSNRRMDCQKVGYAQSLLTVQAGSGLPLARDCVALMIRFQISRISKPLRRPTGFPVAQSGASPKISGGISTSEQVAGSTGLTQQQATPGITPPLMVWPEAKWKKLFA